MFLFCLHTTEFENQRCFVTTLVQLLILKIRIIPKGLGSWPKVMQVVINRTKISSRNGTLLSDS